MDNVFIYGDNSNIFISAREGAVEREGGRRPSPGACPFSDLLQLARAGREIEHAIAVGSLPPELRHVRNRLENEGVSWRHGCNRRMREWAERNGIFVALGDFYDGIAFLEPSMPGEPIAGARHAAPMNAERRV